MLYIFDWDGTLSDSLDRIASAMRGAFQDNGLSVPAVQERKSTVGLGLKEAFLALHPDLDEIQMAAVTESYRQHYLGMDLVSPSPLFEGAMEVLVALKDDGHQLAVATGKSRLGLNRILEHMQLTIFFDASRCADETRSKPHPLMLQEILSETGAAKEESVMIGDTDFDLRMASSAGVGAIGVTYGAHSMERLSAASPDRLIDNLTQLL